MQKLFKYFAILTLLIPLVGSAFSVPERPTGFVQDYSGLLSTEQVSTLEAKLQSFEKNSTNEIAVVMIDSLEGDTIENLAQEIFTKWGIGKKDKNNGVLFLIALEDRKTRIHTGYGVEGDLTDLGTSYIQQDIVTPAFREGKYFEGINGAVDKMIEALGGNNIVPENFSKNTGSGFNFELIFFVFIIVIQWIGAILSRSKSWWHGGVLGGIIGGGIIWWFGIAILFGSFIFIILILIGLALDFVVSKSYDKAKSTGNFPWFIGGPGGSGGGGGGFGGFGGGSSGGGGSSSSW